MSDAASQGQTEQFEQALATAFACRSIIKYNSSLGEEQKNELVAEIDTTVKFLRGCLLAHVSPVSPPRQQTGKRSSKMPGSDDKPASKSSQSDNENDKHKLAELYRIAQLYLATNDGHGISEFGIRFNKAMSILDEVQAIATNSSVANLYPNPHHVEDLLHRVRGLLADIYTVFIELARAISNVLQGSGIYIDTEELSSIQQQRSTDKDKHPIQDIGPLLRIYEAHVQFNEKKGTIASRIDDATAFLLFLEDSLGSDVKRRDMVVAQLKKVAKLLNDLSYLLSSYESTMAGLLRQE